jgi:hypothetical protein
MSDKQNEVKIVSSKYISDCCNAAPAAGLWYDPTAAWMGNEIVRYGKCSQCGQKAAFHLSPGAG